MMNRYEMKANNGQKKGWRRFLALLSALMLLISSTGITAFAEAPDEDIYSDPVTAPIPKPAAEETPAPETSEEPPEEETTEPVPEEETEEPTEEVTPEEETPEEETPEPTPEIVYNPGSLTGEADGVTVRLDYTAEACIPDDVIMTFRPVNGAEYYSAMKSVSKLVRQEENTDSVWTRVLKEDGNIFYIVTLADSEGNEIQPAAAMTLTVENLTAGEEYYITGSNAHELAVENGSLIIPEYSLESFGHVSFILQQTGNITLEHNGPDYQVIATYGPDAGFPAGTELKVREILPGTAEYRLYSGMTDEALNEEWAEITLERYFDITFVADGKELEPEGFVDVQIIFRDKIEQNEETEVQAVHIENNEANVIEAETDSNKAAKHDEEAIDTVAFTSDSFSVFGVVQKKKITQKVLAADGNTYEINVTYTAEAAITEGSTLKVEEIPEGSDLWEAYRKQTAAALGADDVRLPGLYDITIIDPEGNPVEPVVPVNVSIKLANAETDEDLHVVHFTEDIPQELVEAAAEEKKEEQTEVQSLTEEELIAHETITDKTVEGDIVTFATAGFSVYAFAYTVDFYYGEYEYHLEGGTYMSLKNLLLILHITETENVQDFVNNIENVTFSDTQLLSITKVTEATTVGALIVSLGLEPEYSTRLDETKVSEINSIEINPIDWALISLSPFFTDEQLTINMQNGDKYSIRVTDAASFKYKAYVNHKSAGYITNTDKNTFAGGTYYDIATEENNSSHKYAFVKTKNTNVYGIKAVPYSGFRFAFWYEIKANGTIERYNDAILTGNPLYYADGSVFFACFIANDDKLLVMGDPQPTNDAAWWYTPSETMAAYDSNLGLSRYLINPTDVSNSTNFKNEFSDSYKYQFVGWVAQGRSKTRLLSTRMEYTLPNISEDTLMYPLYELKPEYRNTRYVWLDGSDGIGFDGGDNTYFARTNEQAIREGAGQEVYVVDINTQFKLPSVCPSSDPQYKTEHHYTEVDGWYDVVHKRMYRPGDSPTITDDTVFYASWFPKNYDFSQNADKTQINTANTNGFITTSVYDYNNMYNMRKLTRDSSASFITSMAHYEQWNLNMSTDKFIFLTTKAHVGSTVYPVGMRGTNENDNHELNPDNDHYNGVPAGISEPADLFDTTIDGVKRVGDGNYLFKYDSQTGYYSYDSSVNAAAYDGSRFRVYAETEKVQETYGTSDFLPFNNGKKSYKENYGEPDYWFGMKSEIDFYLPNTPGEKISTEKYGNRSIKDDEMVYKFSGDDDVWVYVDNTLVLNMSGIHGPVYGEINFSKGTYTIAKNGVTKTTDGKGIMTYANDGTGEVVTNDLSAILNMTAGDHKLKLVYLERGASQSNCAIYFNLAPRYTLQIQKKDADGQNLGPATFGVYLDEECTVAANVWGRYTSNTTNIFTTGDDGIVHISGIAPGKTYYLRELTAPAGYPDVSQEVITLELDSQGTPTVSYTGDAELVSVSSTEASGTSNQGEFRIALIIKNINQTSITAKKVWSTLDGGTSNINPNSVSVKLQRYTLSNTETESAPEHTVRINTQYFGTATTSYASDEYPLVTYQTSSHKVREGGSITFNVLTSGSTAIYSITSRYGNINTSYSATSTQTYLVNGSMEEKPHNAVVTLSNITNDSEIYITYIGDAVDGLNASVGEITTTDGNGQVRAKVQDEGFNASQIAVELDAGNEWKHTWSDLASSNGTDTYYYYIVETNPVTTGITASDWDTAYITTYSSNGLTSGTVAVHNTFNAKKVKMRKQDSSTQEGLAGATFLLYTKDSYEANGAPVNMTNNTGLLEETTFTSGSDTLFSNNKGRFYTGYIPLGSYVLVEVDAPSGYQRLAYPLEMRITEKYLEYWNYGVDNAVTTKVPVSSDGYFHLDIDNTMTASIEVAKNWVGRPAPSGASVEVTLGRYKLVDNQQTTVTEYTVSFNANGGSGTMQAVSVEEGVEYTLPGCSFNAPTGYEFDRWNLGNAGAKITVDGNKTLIAQWRQITPETWTISFDANGGSGSMSSTTVNKGDQFTLPECGFEAPSGKEFAGWDLGAPGIRVDISSNTTIYAQWEDVTPTSFTVTLKVTGDGIPSGKTMWLQLQDLSNNYSPVDSKTMVSGTGTYTLTATDVGHKYQLCFGNKDALSNCTITGEYLDFCGSATYYNIYQNNNGRYLVNSGEYTINITQNQAPQPQMVTLEYQMVHDYPPYQTQKSGSYSFPAGTTVTFAFSTKDQWDRIANENRGYIEFNGQRISYNKRTQNGNQIYEINLTVTENATLVIYLNANSANDIISVSCTPVSTGSVNTYHKGLLDFFIPVAYAEEAVIHLSPTDANTPSLPAAPEGKQWVKDTTWAVEDRIVTLSGSTWRASKTVDATDDENNPYLYYIDEVHEYGFDATDWNAVKDGQIVWGDHASNSEHTGSTLSVTNTYTGSTTGNLKVTKTVTGNAGDTTRDFEFTVTLTGHTGAETFTTVKYSNEEYTDGTLTFNDGVASFSLEHLESLEIKDLPENTVYTVTETNTEGYTTTNTGNTTGTISANNTITVGFTNEKNIEPGGLTLKKIVNATDNIEEEQQKEFTFTIEILNEDDSCNTEFAGSYGLTFTNGKATIDLKHNEEITISGLPYGTKYKISESYADDYNQDNLYAQSVTVNGIPREKMPLVDVISGTDTVGIVVTNTKVDTVNVEANKTFTTGTVKPTAVQLTLKRKGDARDSIHDISVVTVTEATGWKAVWTNLEKYYVDGTTPYTYFVVETGVYFGAMPDDGVIPSESWVPANISRVSGGELADAGNGWLKTTILNTSLIDVPVIKNWPDFSSDEFGWYVKFKLYMKEELVFGNASTDDANLEWVAADREPLTVTKGPAPSFEDLNVYNIHSNGNVYRVLYKAEEIEYKVWEISDPDTAILQWSEGTPPQQVTYNGTYYLPVFDREIAGSETTNDNLIERYSIVVNNMPQQNYSGKLVVHKKWLDVLKEDLPYYPEVYVSLYYCEPNNINKTSGKRYDLDTNDVYKNHPLNYENNWTWVIDNLPDQYRYFVVEEPLMGLSSGYDYLDNYQQVPVNTVIRTNNNYCNTEEEFYVRLDSYRASDVYGSNQWISDPYQADKTTFGYAEPYNANTGNSGEILIQNRCPYEYMQLDIKKKFLQYRIDENNVASLWTTTSEDDVMSNMLIEIQLYRRIIKADADTQTPPQDVVVDWKTYGYPFRVGYREAKKSVIEKDPRNPFDVIDGDGTWQFRIPCDGQRTGLPRRGFYEDEQNKTLIPVRYQYLFKEIAVYDGYGTPIGGDWTAWLPYLWDPTSNHAQTKVQVFKLEVAQDDDRILNTPGTSLTVLKEWIGSHANVKELYVKVERKTASTNWEDFTSIISSELQLGELARDYLGTHPDIINLQKGRLVLKESNGWEATLNKLPIYNAGNKEPYQYRIVETGYLDMEGVEHNCDEFTTVYYNWDITENGFVENVDNASGIVLLQRNKAANKLKVTNSAPNGSLQIVKQIYPLGRETEAENVEFTFNVTLNNLPVDRVLSKNDLSITGDGIINDDFNRTGNTARFTVTITGAGTATIGGIPFGTTYTVEEQSPPAGWQKLSEVYSDETKTIAVTDNPIDTVTVTNTETVTITVKKKWLQTDGSTVITDSIRNAAITVKLTDGTSEVLKDANNADISSVILNGTETTKWTYTWTNLPKYYPNGDPISYQVVETSATVNNGTELLAVGTTQTAVPDSTIDRLFHLENTLPNTERHALKIWDDDTDAKHLRPAEIKFTLSGKAGGNSVTIADSEKTISVDDQGVWQADWTDLPVYTNDGIPIDYDVTESDIPNYSQTNKEYKDNTFTWEFTNQLNEVNLRIIKDETGDSEKKLSGAIFELSKKNSSDEYVAVTDNSISGVNEEGRFVINETITLTGITDGEYQIEEITAPNGYLKYKEKIYFTVTNGKIDDPTVDGTIIRYTAKTASEEATLYVANTPGVELPETGGSGTLIYTITGLALVMLAGVIFLARRKRNHI